MWMKRGSFVRLRDKGLSLNALRVSEVTIAYTNLRFRRVSLSKRFYSVYVFYFQIIDWWIVNFKFNISTAIYFILSILLRVFSTETRGKKPVQFLIKNITWNFFKFNLILSFISWSFVTISWMLSCKTTHSLRNSTV